MKFAIAKEHRDFFQKQGWIEFEDFLLPDQIRVLNQVMDEALAKRLAVPLEKLSSFSSEELFLKGRDLWRESPELRRFAVQPRFGEIASELLEQKPLRLGYDQFLPSCPSQTIFQKKPSVYSSFIDQTASLESVSCLKGLLCGLIIALNENEAEEGQDPLGEGMIDIFPNQAGHAIYFQSTAPIHWKALNRHQNQRFYFIVYTKSLAFYQLQPQDPHTHALKHLGYILNDKLTDRLNPIVFR